MKPATEVPTPFQRRCLLALERHTGAYGTASYIATYLRMPKGKLAVVAAFTRLSQRDTPLVCRVAPKDQWSPVHWCLSREGERYLNSIKGTAAASLAIRQP